MPNALAKELNNTIQQKNPAVFNMLSTLGQELYFPKGILTQTAEAKQKAKKYNATIGIAKEKGVPMHLPSIMSQIPGTSPDEALNYAPSPGHAGLRQEWKKMMGEKNPSLKGKEFSLPLVTCGITHGLSLVSDMFVNPGDTVMVPDQLWGNYNLIYGIRRSARVVKYPFFSEKGGFDSEGFAQKTKEASSQKKIIVLLNFPNNPSGYTVTEKEADRLTDTLIETAKNGCQVVAVCDDAYFGLRFEDDAAKESLFARLLQKHDNLLAVKLDGATKEDYVWGFRVGFATFSAVGGSDLHMALEKKAGGCIRGMISNDAQLSQSLVLKAMHSPDYQKEKQDKYNVMKARYQKTKEVLARQEFSETWTAYPFNSGYFMCVKLKDLNAEEFRVRLLDEYGIGVIATTATDIRVAFSCLEVDEIDNLFTLMRECALKMKNK